MLQILCEFPVIQNCKLLMRTTSARQRALLLFVVLNSCVELPKDVQVNKYIWKRARDSLPSFVTLGEVCIVDKLPLTAHGCKIATSTTCV